MPVTFAQCPKFCSRVHTMESAHQCEVCRKDKIEETWTEDELEALGEVKTAFDEGKRQVEEVYYPPMFR